MTHGVSTKQPNFGRRDVATSGPGVRTFGCPDDVTSRRLDVRTSGSEVRTSGHPDFRTAGRPDGRISKPADSDVQMSERRESGRRDVRTCGRPDARTSMQTSGLWTSRRLDVRISGLVGGCILAKSACILVKSARISYLSLEPPPPFGFVGVDDDVGPSIAKSEKWHLCLRIKLIVLGRRFP